MTGFTLQYTTKNKGFVEISGDDVKYWESTGLPTYEGGTEGFEKLYPQVVKEMLDRKIIKKILS